MKSIITLLISLMFSLSLVSIPKSVSAETKVLFIGNSFTFGWGSAVRHYRADSVTDLNHTGIGGVPALFQSFADQANLDYQVFVETRGGAALDFHLEQKLDVIGTQAWDQVVMHGFSTLDSKKPGDASMLIDTSSKMATFLISLNPEVEVYLTSTWSRADLVYPKDRFWSGTPIEKMALDVRAGNDKAAAASDAIKSVNPVGEAWTRAMQLGIADKNPYDGIDFGKVSLWTWDHYHASTYGYYLHALVVFGNLTGIDPRMLGENECSAYELGMSKRETSMLQQAASETLVNDGKIKAASANMLSTPSAQKPCSE